MVELVYMTSLNLVAHRDYGFKSHQKYKCPSDGTGIHNSLRNYAEVIVGCGFDSHLGYMIRTDILERKADILNWIANKESNTEIARRLNCKLDTLKSYYRKMGITYAGNQGMKGKKSDPKRKSALEILGSLSFSNSAKRIRLIEDGIKEERCECCGLLEWMGKPIPLELHHKDFNHYNNSLDNLQILCANCHMQAHNYCNTIK